MSSTASQSTRVGEEVLFRATFSYNRNCSLLARAFIKEHNG